MIGLCLCHEARSSGTSFARNVSYEKTVFVEPLLRYGIDVPASAAVA
jgi:hypothetical protein